MSTTAKAPTKRRRRTKPLRASVLGSVGGLATLVGLIVGILTLLFIARPGCQPQPPPEISSVEIGDADIAHGVTFRYYLERANSPFGTLSREQLERRGVLVILHYVVEGYKGKALPLRWQLFDSDGAKVDAGDAVIKPGRQKDGIDHPVWVTPADPGRKYHVVATVFEPDGRISLDSFRTDEFGGLASTSA